MGRHILALVELYQSKYIRHSMTLHSASPPIATCQVSLAGQWLRSRVEVHPVDPHPQCLRSCHHRTLLCPFHWPKSNYWHWRTSADSQRYHLCLNDYLVRWRDVWIREGPELDKLEIIPNCLHMIMTYFSPQNEVVSAGIATLPMDRLGLDTKIQVPVSDFKSLVVCLSGWSVLSFNTADMSQQPVDVSGHQAGGPWDDHQVWLGYRSESTCSVPTELKRQSIHTAQGVQLAIGCLPFLYYLELSCVLLACLKEALSREKKINRLYYVVQSCLETCACPWKQFLGAALTPVLFKRIVLLPSADWNNHHLPCPHCPIQLVRLRIIS